MSHHVLYGIHNLGDAGLVVSAEKRCAVGGDESFAFVSEQLGELVRRQEKPVHTLQGYASAII